MRFLKKKIALAVACLKAKETKLQEPNKPFLRNKEKITSPLTNSQKRGKRVQTEADIKDPKSTKNIAKNFGKAICNFSLSDLALTYLNPLLEEKEIEYKDFQRFVNKAKEKIKGILSFRSVLMTHEDDSPKAKALKEIFKAIGVVFIKYFSVNWIFHGKILHKKAHLNFRFKMLRRIQSPELFTFKV